MRILVVEDEKKVAAFIKRGLEQESYAVDVVEDGVEGQSFAEMNDYDAIILDIMLPGKNGLEVLKDLKSAGVRAPVLLLTARDSVEDRVKGLNIGADDYLTKPFVFGELLARVRTLIRRQSAVKESIVRIADLEINTSTHEVMRGGIHIPLSAREYALLEYLAYHKDNVVSRTDIVEHIYKEDTDMDSNIVDVYINYLRNKIDKDHKEKLIHTVRGAGYMLRTKEV